MTHEVEFWTKHSAMSAMEIAYRYLGKALLHNGATVLGDNRLWAVGYSWDFDFARVEAKIRAELDEIDWLFVSLGAIEYNGRELPGFGLAPILPRKLTVAYHATRLCLIPRICGEHGEGLLPSNSERRATRFADTEGTIHVCEKLTYEGTERNSAVWWMTALSKKNNFKDPAWGIVRIDMTRLPPGARAYKDMHSTSGVVVDRLDRIPGDLIEAVEGQSTVGRDVSIAGPAASCRAVVRLENEDRAFAVPVP
jgi:hypothetical protein